jgi:hypothetical protein
MKKTIPFILFFLAFASFDYPGEENYTDYELKSAMIYKICIFTQWPQPQDPNKPFILSVLGKLPPGNEISLIKEATIQKRKILIRKIENLEEIGNSDVLFITSSETNRLEAILEYVEGKSVLTVSDSKGFGKRGVMINFFINRKNEKIEFEINIGAVKKTLLQMNPQLYTIGRVIDPVKSTENEKTQMGVKND